jgi:hypothetical protein
MLARRFFGRPSSAWEGWGALKSRVLGIWMSPTVIARCTTGVPEPKPGTGLPLEEALVQARSTGCRKYVGKASALRAEIAASARRWREAEADASEALRIACEICIRL